MLNFSYPQLTVTSVTKSVSTGGSGIVITLDDPTSEGSLTVSIKENSLPPSAAVTLEIEEYGLDDWITRENSLSSAYNLTAITDNVSIETSKDFMALDFSLGVAADDICILLERDVNKSFYLWKGSAITKNPQDIFSIESQYFGIYQASVCDLSYIDPLISMVGKEELEDSKEDISEVPTNILFDGKDENPSVHEKRSEDTLVATLNVVDSNPQDSFSFVITGQDKEDFYITNSKLYTNATFYYADGNTKTIHIFAEDSFGLTYSKTVTVDIVNVPPEIFLTGTSIDENKSAKTLVGTLSSDETVSFSLVAGEGDDDNSDFMIEGTTLKTAKKLDYEASATRSIRVRATKELYSDNIFTITINDKQGAVITWGNSNYGGDSSAVVASLFENEVTNIFSTTFAFAALKPDGSVITWGDSSWGGDSSSIAASLTSGVTEIFSASYAFAALKADGSVITWGDSSNGGDSSSVDLSSGITKIFSATQAFVALKSDGSAITWGNSSSGGDSSSVNLSSGITKIFSTGQAFAALKTDGSVITWGDSNMGGDSSTVSSDLTSEVINIFSTNVAFAALKTDGSVITWGASVDGGDSSTVASDISSGVIEIFSTNAAFAALKTDSSVITWGASAWGGDSSTVTANISSGVSKIFSTQRAFAALKSDGSVITWGDSDYGGNSSTVAANINDGIIKIFYTIKAFAALKSDGSVITWGHSDYGGNSSAASSNLTSGVSKIFSTAYAFAALRED